MSNAGMNNDVSSTRAVREFVFLVGADLIYQGRKVKVRLALPKPDHPEFLEGLRTVADGLPIAAQLEWSTSGDLSAQPDHVIPSCHLMFHRPHYLRLRENSTAEFGFHWTHD